MTQTFTPLSHLVRLGRLHDEGVAGGAPLLQPALHHHEAIRRRLRPDVDACEAAPEVSLHAWLQHRVRMMRDSRVMSKTGRPGTGRPATSVEVHPSALRWSRCSSANDAAGSNSNSE